MVEYYKLWWNTSESCLQLRNPAEGKEADFSQIAKGKDEF